MNARVLFECAFMFVERAFILFCLLFERAFCFRTRVYFCLNARFVVERAFLLMLLNARLIYVWTRVFFERAFCCERAFLFANARFCFVCFRMRVLLLNARFFLCV